MKNKTENPWITHRTRQIYDNPWIRVSESDVTNPSGGEGIYGVVHFKNRAVGIIPVDEQDCTWLVGQFRYTLDSYEWEIPAGGCPEGELPEQTAMRELREETGLSAMKLEPLLTGISLSNSITDERGFLFLATGLTQGIAAPEETEQLEIRRLPVDDAIAMVMDGQITDTLSVAGLLSLGWKRLAR